MLTKPGFAGAETGRDFYTPAAIQLIELSARAKRANLAS
jgi:hypothetical protein